MWERTYFRIKVSKKSRSDQEYPGAGRPLPKKQVSGSPRKKERKKISVTSVNFPVTGDIVLYMFEGANLMIIIFLHWSVEEPQKKRETK
jgi:hypothetical protein